MKIRKYKKIFNYILEFKSKILLMILSMLISQICALTMPGIMAKIVDVGMGQYGCGQGYIMKMGLYMIIVSLISAIFSVMSGYFMSKFAAGISMKLRSDIFDKVLDLSAGNLDKLSTSSLITRATNDVEHVKSFLIMSVHILMPPFMILGGLYMALVTCAKMSWIIALSSLLSVIIIVAFLRFILPRLRRVQKLNDRFNLIVRERLSGMIISRVFNNDEYEFKKFDKCNEEFSTISFFVSKMAAFVVPSLTYIMNFACVCVIWFGAKEIQNLNMNVGDVMAFMQYCVLVVMSFLMLSLMISAVPKALISVERILEILNIESEPETACKVERSVHAEKLELCNVCFRYAGAKDFAIKDMSLEVFKGEKLGIIGSTGSGKSTIFKLILGYYTPTQGSILIDGADINKLDRKSVNDNIAYVPQEPMIFGGTVESNLRLGNENITYDEMCRALKIVQMEYLANIEGLNKCVEQSGSNFSGGEKQRLALARAIVKPKKIYILDDNFSKLDFATDYKLRKDLFESLSDSIFLIVSQRVGTISKCDKIIVLDDGKIVAQGTHVELLRASDLYHDIARMQLGAKIDE